MAKMKIKKGDLVQVITGRTSDADKAAKRELAAGDKGKQGRVLEVYPEAQKVLVEGVNRRTHHLKANPAGGAGGIEQREAPIHVSNVMVVDSDGNPTRVGYRFDENGKKIRVSKRNGKDI